MAEVFGDPEKCGIQKKVLYAGTGTIPSYPDGTKVTFQYQTRRCNTEKTVIDDNRKHKPMELIMGKKFKLEVWEMCLRSMREKEVASFTCHTSLVSGYPMVAKSLRDINHNKHHEQKHHCCGMALQEYGLGYPDLDELMRQPEDLEFILDLQKVEEPGDYKKEAWVMDETEKLSAIPRLKEEGNALYKEKKHALAADKYAEAIGMLEQLLLREKPHDVLWNELNVKKVPLLLNFAQCKLLLQDYYPVIEHCTSVLAIEPDNVKALYRRAKAHVGAWNPEDAKIDFTRALELDSSLANAVKKEIAAVEQKQKDKDNEDRKLLEGKMFG